MLFRTTMNVKLYSILYIYLNKIIHVYLSKKYDKLCKYSVIDHCYALVYEKSF